METILSPWILSSKNSTLGHPVPAFQDKTWNCIIGDFPLNRRNAAFFIEIVEPWKRLPVFVVEPQSADIFKSKLDASWTDEFSDVIQYSTTSFLTSLRSEFFFLQ